MPLTYRPATLDDHAAVTEVRMSVTENILSDPSRATHADYDAYITTIGCGFLAEEEGRVIGFAMANRSGLIWALFLRPGWEGRGIGKHLLGLCLAWLQAQGVRQAMLETDAGTRAEAFYRRQGWRETGRTGPAITFTRDLPAPPACA